MQDSNFTEELSVLTDPSIDTTQYNALKGSGAWAKFIGIVYLLSAAMLFLIIILVIANLEMLVHKLIVLNGLSESTLFFLMGAGKWLFTCIMSISGLVFFLNGFLLLKFGNASNHFIITKQSELMENAFQYLGRYMMLTAVLSVLSTVISIAALLFYIFS